MDKVSVVIKFHTNSYIFKTSVLMLIPFHSLWSIGPWKLPATCFCFEPFLDLFPSVTCLWRLIVDGSPPAVPRTTLVSLSLLVLCKCMPGNIANRIHRVCPILPHLHLLIWMLIRSCSVLSHKSLFLITCGQCMPMIARKNLLTRDCKFVEVTFVALHVSDRVFKIEKSSSRKL